MGKLIFIIKNVIKAGLLLSCILLLRSEYEKSCLNVPVYNIKTKKKINGRKRIVFLSDLHNKQFGRNNERLTAEIDKLSPDIILIGGDMPVVKKTDKEDDTNKNIEALDLDTSLNLCERLAKKYPVFYANGNHELRLKNIKKYGNAYQTFKYKLKKSGVHYLEDTHEVFENFVIYGLDIDGKYYTRKYIKSMSSEYINQKLGSADSEKFTILLAHSPMYHEKYAEWGADLALSGHFHGGTIRLFNNIGLMTPQYDFFSDRVVGMKDINGRKLIISAGLGTHSINIRLNNKPEIVVINVEPV